MKMTKKMPQPVASSWSVWGLSCEEIHHAFIIAGAAASCQGEVD